MGNVITTKAATVTNTTVAVLLLAANRGAQYRSVSLPVASTLFIGGPGVTTAGGTSTGILVSSTIPFTMTQNDYSGIGIYQGDLWGVATAICTATVVEVSS